MSIDFIGGSSESVYVDSITPPSDIPFRVSVPFKSDDEGCLFFLGEPSGSNDYIVMYIQADSTIRAWAREIENGGAIATVNTIDTSGVNVASFILDYGGAGSAVRLRVKLNGGTAASSDIGGTGANISNLTRVAFGRFMDSSPSNEFTGQMEQPCAWVDNDDFADHDAIWNSGTVLDPSTLTLGEAHRWPFNEVTGSVVGTDTEIDDAVGAYSLDTVGGTPTYTANFLATAGGGPPAGSLGLLGVGI